MMNLAGILDSARRAFPDRPALIHDGTALTYAGFDAAACRVAEGLAEAGLRPGDRIALCCPNTPHFPIAFFGILKMGGVAVAIDPLLQAGALANCLAAAEVSALVGYGGDAMPALGPALCEAFAQLGPGRRGWLAGGESEARAAGLGSWDDLERERSGVFDTVQRDESDPAVILFTSGTAQRPLAAVWGHANAMLYTLENARLSGCTCFDRALALLPLSHALAQHVLLQPVVASGGCIVLAPRFDAGATWRLMAEHQVTLLAGVPTLYWRLYRLFEEGAVDPEPAARALRTAISAGAPVPGPLLRALREDLGFPFQEWYGSTEGGFVVPPREVACAGDVVGLALRGNEMKLVGGDGREVPRGAVGEVVTRGHNTMQGYYNAPEATAERLRGGWLHTGDLGRIGEDGMLRIVGRIKDTIIRGGYNVAPREVVDVLLRHPDVSMAAVAGLPDPEYGEEVVAFVVPVAGVQADAGSIRAFAREHLPPYAYPRRIKVVPSLPVNQRGKVPHDALLGLLQSLVEENGA